MCDPHCRTQYGFQGLVQKEWITVGHRFYSRVNYHRDNDKEEVRGRDSAETESWFLVFCPLLMKINLTASLQAPVFLLFLDCVWQLLSQYPSRFQLTNDFLLALHDSIHLPLFSSFLANCQRERCKRSQVRDTRAGRWPPKPDHGTENMASEALLWNELERVLVM